jgi:hypothetical protein
VSGFFYFWEFTLRNLETIADEDLKALITVCDAMAKEGNRFFCDLFVILSKEALSRHKGTDLSNYSTNELGEALERLKAVVDESRSAGVNDDYPALSFARVTLAAAIAELERREKTQ